MKLIFLSAFWLLSCSIFAQIECLELPGVNGGSIKTCFHENGKTSTVVNALSEREGKVKGYSSQGVELFNYETRKYAGHASVSLRYHPNGQVARVEYSNVPDGGVQSYRETLFFDEQGNLINKEVTQ